MAIDVGGGGGRRGGLQARRHAPACRARPPTRSPAPASPSRARSRPRSASARSRANVTLRKLFETYANIRPARQLPGVPTRYDGEGVDFIVVRENIEDLYAGVEYLETRDVAVALKIDQPARLGEDRSATRSSWPSARVAARSPCATKANILKLTEGLFKRVFEELAPGVPGASSRSTSSSTTSPTRWPRTPPSSTSSSPPTSPATSSATSPRAWSAASASRRRATTATTSPSSRRSTARRPSTPARTSSTPRRSS